MNNNIVNTNRLIYTTSEFAKSSLMYLQEGGVSKTLKKHTSSREYLDSFLFFIVLDGYGYLNYDGKKIKLSKNEAAFINCNKPYSHTSDNWKISWIHFNGNNMKNIYDKYLNRNGKISFKVSKEYEDVIVSIIELANSDDFLKDMNINAKLSNLLFMIMSNTIYSNDTNRNRIYNINDIKDYIDNNYSKEISLETISNTFYINKFYLTRLFKETFGTTIINYLNRVRITKSKELVRYSNNNLDDIARSVGFKDQNYYSRIFKKIEGISPREYKRKW